MAAPTDDAGRAARKPKGKRAARLSKTAFFQGETRPVRADRDEIDVIDCNWPAVQVYVACQWTFTSGMALHWLGISAMEINAAMRNQRVPVRAWPDTERRVRQMVDFAMPIRNKKK